MKEYDAYLFDADGTLIDTRELIYRSFVHMTETMRLPVPGRAAVDALIGLPMGPQLERFIGPDRDGRLYAEGHEIYHDFHMTQFHRYLGVFPGVREGLAALRDMNKKLIVVSSRNRKTLVPFMEALEISGFFPTVISADDCEKHKPHPEPALRGLEAADADAGASVFIGDAEFDMCCGKGAGLDVAYVLWGGMDYANWPVKPDFVAETFADLLPGSAERAGISRKSAHRNRDRHVPKSKTSPAEG